MSDNIQLIVGLANPGKAYQDTRHNAGGWFVEQLAARAHVLLKHELKYHGLYQAIRFQNDQICHLLIPTTYMNLSGQSVRAVMQYYKIPSSAILVAHDEVDMPAGVIKLKFDGGDGGHNGLKDIIRHLNTKQFHRLRIGVGHPGNSKDVADYVLSTPSKSERLLIEQALLNAEETLPFLLQGKIQEAMQQLHTNK